ncbi:N-6 DNA methylase [Devosia rhizoryzae]|uniref:site-specific DNA-methyltransferase (adenine-specific) n=1 Tax=Devosia rhizoryzae TaxID=2774137 RepID=A0ABX7C5T0_9HYPH|nr:N-6 DNA methylase [Devosia rhizoryzae]QQR39456.1 N-6 DNA methylase [Devosia rhizoryzae]
MIATKRANAKILGAFYTPATIAGMLAEWVVQTGNERLLEPSVGDGALLAAAIERRRELRGARGELRFLACDIDAAAIQALEISLPDTFEARAVDFLQLDPASTGLFTSVLVNPPFTRNHSIEPARREILRRRFGVNGAAGLWVHFLIHSMDFLAPGGRLAAIVPAAALFTTYGRNAIERICAQFAHVEIRQIVDKPLWTNGAAERGAVILASGYGVGHTTVPTPSRWLTNGYREPSALPMQSGVFGKLAAIAIPLGDLASIAIGAVTGCNAVFLLSEEERLSLDIPIEQLTSIASRARQLPGLTITCSELLDSARAGEKTWLLTPENLAERGTGVRRRLAQISKRKRAHTVWLNKRDPWWQVDVGPPCDAFYTYMNDLGPRLVLADPQVRCTNTLHRVTFKADILRQQRIAASLSMVSTFGQLAAEKIGRSYGGGLLKFELMDARRVPILPARQESLEAVLMLADHALRSGNRDRARALADEALIAPILGSRWESDVLLLEDELKASRMARRGG